MLRIRFANVIASTATLPAGSLTMRSARLRSATTGFLAGRKSIVKLGRLDPGRDGALRQARPAPRIRWRGAERGSKGLWSRENRWYSEGSGCEDVMASSGRGDWLTPVSTIVPVWPALVYHDHESSESPQPSRRLSSPAPWRLLAGSETSTKVAVPRPFPREPDGFHLRCRVTARGLPGTPALSNRVSAVARNREHHDESIFETSHPERSVAFVHMTWAVEGEPTFPYTAGYISWEAFYAAWAYSDA